MRKKYIYLLLIPGILFLISFVFLPIFNTIYSTVKVGNSLTLKNYTSFFEDSYFVKIYLRTIKLSLITTLICIVLGFPTAYYISKKNVKQRGIYIVLAVFPLLTSSVVRSFSWIIVLGKKGIINTILTNLKIVNHPLDLLYNEFSIVVGFVHLFLPLMILSLVGVMENIDGSLIRAAESLGAPKIKAFLKVIVPLSIPGLIIGSVLVFTGSLTAYTTPSIVKDYQVYASLLIGHTIIVLPYIIRVISSSLSNFDYSVEEAAVSLGANKFKAFFMVVFPNIRSGVIAAFILAFINSFNNVPVSVFLTGPGISTLPIKMLSYVEYYFDPTVAALSVILMIMTIILMFIIERTLGLSYFTK